mgnify:CR=1 FL=1
MKNSEKFYHFEDLDELENSEIPKIIPMNQRFPSSFTFWDFTELWDAKISRSREYRKNSIISRYAKYYKDSHDFGDLEELKNPEFLKIPSKISKFSITFEILEILEILDDIL